jgi:hypothetical protein
LARPFLLPTLTVTLRNASALCDALLARADFPERLRQRVEEYAHTIRIRRDQWYEELILEAV